MYRQLRYLVLALAAGLPSAARAQGFAPRDSITVAAGERYRAGGLHRFFFGSHYRDLWTMPIRVPVLHLQEFGGGLKPTQRGGGMQTKSLRLAGADGREYQFRSIDKDPTPVLPPDLRETIAANILQDQISATHPGGYIVVPVLLQAAGVLHPTPIIVQMADDPALGEFRQEFAGLLGTIEERPRGVAEEGFTFAGSRDIVGTADLFKKIDDDPAVRVDSRAFLLARLMDVFVGDWDRHADQWRWALIDSAPGGGRRWLPIPRDRDQAFVRYDGFLLSQARKIEPKLLNFGAKYNDIDGATWNGRDLDRRILAELPRSVWDSVAAVLKGRLTDDVLARAAHAMPAEYYPVDGARLEQALRGRRDGFDRMVDTYYRMLAHQVEVYGSDRADQARVERQDDATVVKLARGGQVYYERRFNPRETQEVRLHLQGGDDQVYVTGEGSGSPRLRAIGGGGDDRYEIIAKGGVHLYDDRGTNQAVGKGLNRKAWTWKPDSLKPNELPPRDWGKKTQLWPTAGYAYDALIVLGYGGHTDWYAFRRVPYSTRLIYRAEFATGKVSGRVSLGIVRSFENSRAFFGIEGQASGIESLRWYGFGNETVFDHSVSFYRVTRNELTGMLKLGRRFGKSNEVSFGPVVVWSQTDTTLKSNANKFITQDSPYGIGRFGLAGGRVLIRLDNRDYPKFPSKGLALTLQATGYPKWWDADEAIARVDGEASVSLAPQGRWRPSLHLMAGGSKTWGKLPFFLAPTLGGLKTLRGYRPERFAGEASIFGAGELRIPLTRLQLVVPGQQGIFGFADAGRVYVEGDDSDELHTSIGAGVWFSFLTRNNVLYVGAAKPTKDKAEGTRLVLGFGFPY